jgi:hypothetical protein
MIAKTNEKSRAVELRKAGYSYNEILNNVPVAKSTLSVWLRNLGIAKRQKQRLTVKRKAAQLKAQEACRTKRIRKEAFIIENAKKEISNLSKRDLWLIGVTLYWAEGTKQKSTNVSQRVTFNNSDPEMIVFFDKWLRDICKIPKRDLVYSIYMHRTADKDKIKRFWEKIIKHRIDRIYFKNHNPKTNRKNIEINYNGLLRIDVRRSTDFNRKIKGWTNGIVENLKLNTGE